MEASGFLRYSSGMMTDFSAKNSTLPPGVAREPKEEGGRRGLRRE